MTSCKKRTYSEFYSYRKDAHEIYLLEINRVEKKYELNMLIEGTKNNINIFGLIITADEYTNNTKSNTVYFPDTISFNEIKFSNSRTKKAPFDTSMNLYFDLKTNQLTLLGDTLNPLNTDYNESYLNLVDSFV